GAVATGADVVGVDVPQRGGLLPERRGRAGAFLEREVAEVVDEEILLAAGAGELGGHGEVGGGRTTAASATDVLPAAVSVIAAELRLEDVAVVRHVERRADRRAQSRFK